MELLDAHAEQVAERARVAAEPDPAVLVGDAAEPGDQQVAAAPEVVADQSAVASEAR